MIKYRKARQNPGEYRIPQPPSEQPCSQVNVGTYNRWYDDRYDEAIERGISPETQALQYLAQAGYKGLTVDDLARLSPRDKCFEDELIVMADVRAYFTLAYKVWDILGTDAKE